MVIVQHADGRGEGGTAMNDDHVWKCFSVGAGLPVIVSSLALPHKRGR